MKKAKEEIEFAEVKGGEHGPGGSAALDLGGMGDCGWRCASFTLSMIAFVQQIHNSEVAARAESFGKSLKAQTNHYIRNVQKTWQPSWIPDPDTEALESLEGGPVPTDLTSNLEALAREKVYRPFGATGNFILQESHHCCVAKRSAGGMEKDRGYASFTTG